MFLKLIKISGIKKWMGSMRASYNKYLEGIEYFIINVTSLSTLTNKTSFLGNTAFLKFIYNQL